MNCAAVMISDSSSEVDGRYPVAMKKGLNRAIVNNTTSALTTTVVVTETVSPCGHLAADVHTTSSRTPLSSSVATNPPTSTPSPAYSVAFNHRPEMFVADVRNGCFTPKTDAELKFPEPGTDVEDGDGMYPLRLPVGNCSGLV